MGVHNNKLAMSHKISMHGTKQVNITPSRHRYVDMQDMVQYLLTSHCKYLNLGYFPIMKTFQIHGIL